ARFLLAGAIGVVACAFFWGCGLVLGLDQFKEIKDGSASGNCDVDTTKECIPSGCMLAGQNQLLNACTPAECVGFDDNVRVKGMRLPDGGLPPITPLPPTDAGT